MAYINTECMILENGLQYPTLANNMIVLFDLNRNSKICITHATNGSFNIFYMVYCTWDNQINIEKLVLLKKVNKKDRLKQKRQIKNIKQKKVCFLNQ